MRWGVNVISHCNCKSRAASRLWQACCRHSVLEEARIRATCDVLPPLLGQLSVLLLTPLIKLKKSHVAPTIRSNKRTVHIVKKTEETSHVHAK